MNSKNTFKKIFIFFLLSLLTQLAVATEITTRLDRSQININDSIQLVFSTTESPDAAPDFSPLEKDFEILNQNQQSSSSWVNGRSTQSVQWVVKLMAKQVGNLTIPAISFGKDTSKPVSISVSNSPVPNGANNRDEDLFLQVEVTPKTAYVQSQVIYTVRLFRKVQITQASLNEPELADAIIEKLEEDVNYTTELNGRSYAVIEQKYAIFPQKSGSVTIAPVTLTAEVVTNTRRRFNGFFNRQSTQSKRIVSESISLDIKPAPTSFKGKHWIPSEHVHLEEKWSGDIKEMKVGEPLTRTLTLLAKGTTVAQLPELHDENSNSQLKTYPDQPVLKEKKMANGLMAFREEKVAFIPSKPGEYTLPAINIPWFNTQTQKMEMASIPETKVIAIGAALSQDASPDNTITPLQLDTEKNQTQAEIQLIENPLWKWLSIFLGLGWLTTLFFLFKKPKPKQEKILVDNTQSNLKEAVRSLKKACTENNPSQAKDALLAWGKTKFNSNNLSAIGSNCDSTLKNEIQLLSQSLYSTQQTNEWQGRNLLQAFKANEEKKEVSDKVGHELEPLYRL